MKPIAEQMRIRYLYRRKILTGEIRVNRHTAKRLIGPDCAYHLYGKYSITKSNDQSSRSSKNAGKKTG